MNIFFVDDEPLTLQYLKKILDWDALDLHISGMAANGKDALEKMKDLPPDILITDIKMPVMDGMSLIDEVRKNNEYTKIIVLSAYSDFEYARKVFSSGISGYLVKPINEDKLSDLINKTINELKEEAEALEKSSFSRSLAIETLLWEQISKPESDDTFFRKFELLNIQPDLSHFQLISLTFHESPVNRENIIETLLSSCSDPDCNKRYLIRTSTKKWLILLENEIGTSHVSSMGKLLREKLDPSSFLTVSALHSSPAELSTAYDEVQSLNSLHYYTTASSYIFYRKRENLHRDEEIKLHKAVTQYFSHLKGDSAEDLDNYIWELDEKLVSKYQSDVSGYQYFWTLFIILLRDWINKYEKQMQIPITLKNFQNTAFQNSKKSSDIISVIRQITSEILNSPASVAGDSGSSPIKHVKEYIQIHYTEKLTLEDIAEHFAMSKNYLSRIFKDSAGCTLWDYLTMLRVEQAKQMLEGSRSSTADIALKVGYDNQGYFSSVFKKRTGISPKQYRDNINNRELYL